VRSRLLALTALTLLATCLSAVGSAQAGTHALTCEGDTSSFHPNGTGRYFCIVHKVKPNVSVTLSKGQENHDCNRYRSFEAESSGGLFQNGFSTYDHRSVPGRSFWLHDDDPDLRTDELHKMRVRVYDNSERLRFRNHSRFLVNVSWSMRCRV
jgi:hypothetical protein